MWDPYLGTPKIEFGGHEYPSDLVDDPRNLVGNSRASISRSSVSSAWMFIPFHCSQMPKTFVDASLHTCSITNLIVVDQHIASSHS